MSIVQTLLAATIAAKRSPHTQLESVRRIIAGEFSSTSMNQKGRTVCITQECFGMQFSLLCNVAPTAAVDVLIVARNR